MTAAVENAPRFTPADAAHIADELYGLTATADALPSERDQNFRLTARSGEAFVLKIANSGEAREILDLQNKAMQFAASQEIELALPRIERSLAGDDIAVMPGLDGATHFVRLLTWVPGICFAEVNPHSPALLESLGRRLAELDRALANFGHPAMHRRFHWDLRHASMARPHLPLIPEARRRMVETFLERWERIPWADLRTSVIHNDWNDYNVLVDAPGTPERRVKAVLDFGDMVHSATVGDLAVALAYAILGKPDPLEAAAQIVRSYHAVYPLTEPEIDSLDTLVTARLCLSVCYSAYQSRQAPGNEYLKISTEPAWALLEKFAAMPARRAQYVFRHACGLSVLRSGAHVREWLTRCEPAAVVHPDPRTANVLVFDFSVGSAQWEGSAGLTDPTAVERLIFDRMREAAASAGVGRYDEARWLYNGPQFDVPSNDGGERRTIHMGLDLFQPAGSPVFAPLDGVIHSFANNDKLYDYGPTILLEHNADGTPFYTLYGHLSVQSLRGLTKGRRVRKGEQIGSLGDMVVNGGWPPHLHFQIVLDAMGWEGDFPGVARASQRKLWRELCPDPNVLVRIPHDRFPRPARAAEDLLGSRQRHLGPSLSISYDRPLHIVRGFGSRLFSSDGQAYLDCVNNVAHVGHCHPRVVQAAREQSGVLNTNTRYLHEYLVEYIERLTATLPDPLRVVYLVCSGSEANELALRLARAHTGHDEVIVVDVAYHGNTSALVDISPYKYEGPGGRGKPAHVHKVPMPDVYRGPHRGADAGARHAAAVREQARSSRGVAAFFCESALGCGGQIILPDGYLRDAYASVREAGGVCVADEVQTGFGRAGTDFWMFQTQGVVPDIVTLGKPIGNGHPMGAVITTPEIAASFANGMEYFNTFGGNPVSCAVGLAVLDVIRDENLQENAREAGEYLKRGLQAMQPKHELIGDVRGRGLFIGIELVRDRETREPARPEASYLVNRMKDRGFLLSTDGPDHNVIKIKPPIVFSRADADQVIEHLDVVLNEDYLQASVRKTDRLPR